MKSSRAFFPLALALIAAGPAFAGVEPGWTPPVQLDPRTPLEIGQTIRGAGGPVYLAMSVLYQLAPELQLELVDVRAIEPSVATRTIVSDGDIFALGPTSETSNGVLGGSFIDGFQCTHWRSLPPYGVVDVVPVGPAATWVDSVSAAAGPNFFTACTNFDNGRIHVFSSQTNGAGWTQLRTILPSDPLYINFFGGERIGLLLDPEATDPATTLNCILYETLAGGATSKRLNCANGATPISDVEFATDIPNPSMQFDFFIENRIVPCPATLGAGTFTRRVDQSMNELEIAAPANLSWSVNVGINPTGFFSTGAECSFDPDSVTPRLSFTYNVQGESKYFRKFIGVSGYEELLGPPAQVGPMNLARTPEWADKTWAFFGSQTNVGFEASSSPEPFFADGVNDGTTGAWSNTVP